MFEYIIGFFVFIFLFLIISYICKSLKIQKIETLNKLVNGKYSIIYLDDNLKITERVIHIKNIIYNNDINNREAKIIAFCELRNTLCTFILNRITSAIDLKTGKVVKDLESELFKKIESN